MFGGILFIQMMLPFDYNVIIHFKTSKKINYSNGPVETILAGILKEKVNNAD